MPDAGGQGEEALPDPGVDAVLAAGSVAFQGQLALQGVEDRFDPLAHPGELTFGGSSWIVPGPVGDTATPTWPGSSAKPPSARPEPKPSSANATARIARRRGKKKAIVAIGRSILIIIWHLLANERATFTDLGPLPHAQ
jgi:hypothetical protein